jgi:hypothetical protein
VRCAGALRGHRLTWACVIGADIARLIGRHADLLGEHRVDVRIIRVELDKFGRDVALWHRHAGAKVELLWNVIIRGAPATSGETSIRARNNRIGSTDGESAAREVCLRRRLNATETGGVAGASGSRGSRAAPALEALKGPGDLKMAKIPYRIVPAMTVLAYFGSAPRRPGSLTAPGTVSTARGVGNLDRARRLRRTPLITVSVCPS